MPNNWITAWFIASFQFGLCLQRVCFLEIWTDVWFSIAYLWGRFSNWTKLDFFLADPRFWNHNQGFPTFLRGPVIVHHHFTTSVPFGDARVSRDDPAIPGDLQRRRNPWNKMPSSAPMPFYAPKQGRSLRWLVKPDKDREGDTESFGSTGGILVGIGEDVIQFAQLSGLGGLNLFHQADRFI